MPISGVLSVSYVRYLYQFGVSYIRTAATRVPEAGKRKAGLLQEGGDKEHPAFL
jgi:hypothetical protein